MQMSIKYLVSKIKVAPLGLVPFRIMTSYKDVLLTTLLFKITPSSGYNTRVTLGNKLFVTILYNGYNIHPTRFKSMKCCN